MFYFLYYIAFRKLRLYSNKLVLLKMKFICYNLYNFFYKYLICIVLKSNYLFFIVNDNKNFIKIIYYLKNLFNFNFSQLLDIIIVDRLEMKLYEFKRFNYIYVLVSILLNFRIFVSGFLFLFENLPSLINLYKSADWLEREIWDMFGIFFFGHTNLRRILTDYGFSGFPLRKDFPLTGYYDLRYDEISKSIVLEPLELMQEYRFFKLEIPWRK